MRYSKLILLPLLATFVAARPMPGDPVEEPEPDPTDPNEPEPEENGGGATTEPELGATASNDIAQTTAAISAVSMTALGSTEVVAATTAASAAGNDEPTIEPSITVAMTTARATDASETGGAASTQATDASETGSAASTQATDASETGGAASTQATDASETAPETASETGASATTEPATAATTAASIASETGGSAVVSTAKSEVTSAASAETTGASAASETDSMATETAAVTGTMSVTEALPTNVLWCKRGDSSGNCPDYQEPSIEKAEEYIGNLRNYQSGGLKNAANQPVFDFYKDYFPNPPPKDAMNLYTDGGQTGAQVQANENQGSNVGQAYGGYGEGIFGQDVRPFSMIYQDEDLTRLHFQATSAYYVGQGSGGAMLISPLNDVSKATGAKGRPAIWVTDEAEAVEANPNLNTVTQVSPEVAQTVTKETGAAAAAGASDGDIAAAAGDAMYQQVAEGALPGKIIYDSTGKYGPKSITGSGGGGSKRRAVALLA